MDQEAIDRALIDLDERQKRDWAATPLLEGIDGCCTPRPRAWSRAVSRR